MVSDKTSKSIMIIHAEDTHNYGSFMMLINTINSLSKKFKNNCDFVIRLDSESDRIRLKNELGDNSKLSIKTFRKFETKFQGEARYKILYFYRKILVLLSRLVFDLIKIIKNIRKYEIDFLIVLGGDNFNEYYKGWVISTNLIQLKILSIFTNIFLLGQTIGPFYSWRKSLASKVFKDMEIYCRDKLSVDYLRKDLHLSKNVFLSYDLAFLDLPKERKDFYKKYSLKKKDYITVVPSGLYKQYSPDLESYVSTWESLIKSFLNREDLKNKKVVLLPHVVKVDSKGIDDREIIRMLKKRFKDNERMVFIEDVLLPSEARDILGNGILTITGRMHAAISSFQKGVPAIPISYSVKYRGVVGDSLGREDLIIEARDKNLWSSGDIVPLVNEKINYVMENYTSLVKEIESKVLEIKKELYKQIIKL